MTQPELPDLIRVMAHYGIHVQDGARREQQTTCPLGHEDRPSCSVNTELGVWSCHSCGEGGNSITLIRLREGLDDNRSAFEFATAKLGFVSAVRAQPGRAGLSGSAGVRGGYRPRAVRKRAGLAG